MIREILLRAHELLRDNAGLHHYAIASAICWVDEFRTPTPSSTIRAAAAGDSGKVFVVGDDDQADSTLARRESGNVQQFLRDFPAR